MSNSDVVRVLLVEDSATMIEMVKIWLADGLSQPYQLAICTNLQDSLELLREEAMDIIVLDLNLPDCEGLDTFRAVKAAAAESPIVIMSGESDESLAVTAVGEGAQDYIVKRTFGAENPLRRPVLFALERNSLREAERALEAAESQLAVAHAIQQEMLPNESPEIPGFQVAGRCLPAETVAGDYFDYFQMGDGRWAVLIGDVCGHGLGPALLMVSTRGALRALMRVFDDPAAIATHANNVVADDTQQNGRFVTLMFMLIDPVSRNIQLASGGHPAYMFGADGSLKATLNSEQVPLGIVADEDYQSYESSFETGDVMVLYTDGVNEAHNVDNDQFGHDRIFDVIRNNIDRSAEEILQAVYDAVDEFTAGVTVTDDLTVVIVKCLNSQAHSD